MRSEPSAKVKSAFILVSAFFFSDEKFGDDDKDARSKAKKRISGTTRTGLWLDVFDLNASAFDFIAMVSDFNASVSGFALDGGERGTWRRGARGRRCGSPSAAPSPCSPSCATPPSSTLSTSVERFCPLALRVSRSGFRDERFRVRVCGSATLSARGSRRNRGGAST